MSKGGSNREWGYASYDMDNPESEDLTYTSYEKSGSVNQYTEHEDNGHSHYHWDNKDDHDKGRDSDSGREDSNSSENPSTGEVQENGGCYLTSACLEKLKTNFDDKCYELDILRWFRDKFVSEEDISHYYQTAPVIVKAINMQPNFQEIYLSIYQNIVLFCVRAIEQEKFAVAYTKYKESILYLEEIYARPYLEDRLVRTLAIKNA